MLQILTAMRITTSAAVLTLLSVHVFNTEDRHPVSDGALNFYANKTEMLEDSCKLYIRSTLKECLLVSTYADHGLKRALSCAS